MNKLLKRFAVMLLTVVCLCLAISACGGNVQKTSTEQLPSDGGVFGEESVAAASDKYSDFDLDAMWDSKATMITLADSGITISGSGASADGSVLTVDREGTYVLNGDLSDGQVVVMVEKTEKVHLVLNGVNISCSDSSALYVTSADKVSVTVVKDTVNNLSDGKTYVYETGAAEHNSCIYSKDDLTFNGTGTLNVTGNYNNGIATTNDLKIVSGTINVTAVNNAVKGKDSVAINSGIITVTSQDDGIKVENELEAEKGYLCIEGGVINVTAGDDALQSLQTVTISGGMTTVSAGGQAVNCTGTVNIDEDCFKDISETE